MSLYLCLSLSLLKDCLILEKNEHHPVYSFQDDFQEFEMIDDEDEDDDEDEEDEPDPEASPPSPTLGLLQKSRPTTLNLTSAVSQVGVYRGEATRILTPVAS